MGFTDPISNTQGATYTAGFKYTGHADPELVNQLWFNIRTTIGDLQPIEAQREAFQAFLDMIEAHPEFELTYANVEYLSGETVNPTPVE
jgi:hypothetical protein